MTTRALSADAIHILEHLQMLGQCPVTDLTRTAPFAVLVALDAAGLVQCDAVGYDAMVTITDAGGRALKAQSSREDAPCK